MADHPVAPSALADLGDRMAPEAAAEHRAEIRLRIAACFALAVALMVFGALNLTSSNPWFSLTLVAPLVSLWRRLGAIRSELTDFDEEYPEARTTAWRPH